jgi:hypothetical protein
MISDYIIAGVAQTFLFCGFFVMRRAFFVPSFS